MLRTAILGEIMDDWQAKTSFLAKQELEMTRLEVAL